LLLIVATAVALGFANSPMAAAYERVWQTPLGITVDGFVLQAPLVNWIDDALMALFFFVVGLEIKREVLVGELSDRRTAALPIIAALGGMVVPASLYLSLNLGGPGMHGWGVPMATDIAFAIGAMALLGNRVPTCVRVFLVALAIADDLGAVLVIALAYTGGISFVWAAIAALVFVVLLAINRLGIDSPWPYFLIGGLLWFAVHESGIHSTIAGVLVAITIPSRARLDPLEFVARTRDQLVRMEAEHQPGRPVIAEDTQQLLALDIRREARHTACPLQRLEFALHPWTSYVILPLFALANAGVRVVDADVGQILTSPVSLGVVVGLVLGKPVGILAASWIASRLGLAVLPKSATWRHLVGAAALGGIGFTMSLFIANIAFSAPAETIQAKAAILVASVAAGLVGWSILRSAPRQALLD
jgi:NhaA family Na+:H+ antiporter